MIAVQYLLLDEQSSPEGTTAPQIKVFHSGRDPSTSIQCPATTNMEEAERVLFIPIQIRRFPENRTLLHFLSLEKHTERNRSGS
ncbi:AVN_HP_G0045690.mRNA.1.CDS.1 [Saccharomyces cerevisiae]|nr:AVN_HP_G0045690.mRNA.1.CDS.1 [Saccharomyces cerevisiae]CAI6911412.1 AVN_HP_G0045690.mRNA.1.CDS.1 [Saccharomyces cerevisiae]